MGLIASYRYLSDKSLREMKIFKGGTNKILEEGGDQNEEAEILLDIDKMWDVLHFVLTGASWTEPLRGDPLSEAVSGVTPLEETEEFVAYTEKNRVAEILSALESFDIKRALEKFSMVECKDADLYPSIWDYEDEAEDIKADIYDCFQRMKNFYRQITVANGNVMVTVS